MSSELMSTRSAHQLIANPNHNHNHNPNSTINHLLINLYAHRLEIPVQNAEIVEKHFSLHWK